MKMKMKMMRMSRIKRMTMIEEVIDIASSICSYYLQIMSDQSYLMGKKRPPPLSFFSSWRIGDYMSISSSKYKFFSIILLNHHQNIKKAVKDAS